MKDFLYIGHPTPTLQHEGFFNSMCVFATFSIGEIELVPNY